MLLKIKKNVEIDRVVAHPVIFESARLTVIWIVWTLLIFRHTFWVGCACSVWVTKLNNAWIDITDWHIPIWPILPPPDELSSRVPFKPGCKRKKIGTCPLKKKKKKENQQPIDRLVTQQFFYFRGRRCRRLDWRRRCPLERPSPWLHHSINGPERNGTTTSQVRSRARTSPSIGQSLILTNSWWGASFCIFFILYIYLKITIEHPAS